MSKADAYDLVTARIVEALEAGIVPWHRPWKAGPNGFGPTSLATGKPYQGVNVFTLMATSMLRGYESNYWTTFKQAKDRGGSVRKGEKSTPVVFWKFIDKKNAETGKDEKIPFLRYFHVFNLDQCDGLEEPTVETEFEPEDFDPIETAEAIANGMPHRPTVNHGGDSFPQQLMVVNRKDPDHLGYSRHAHSRLPLEVLSYSRAADRKMPSLDRIRSGRL